MIKRLTKNAIFITIIFVAMVLITILTITLYNDIDENIIYHQEKKSSTIQDNESSTSTTYYKYKFVKITDNTMKNNTYYSFNVYNKKYTIKKSNRTIYVNNKEFFQYDVPEEIYEIYNIDDMLVFVKYVDVKYYWLVFYDLEGNHLYNYPEQKTIYSYAKLDGNDFSIIINGKSLANIQFIDDYFIFDDYVECNEEKQQMSRMQRNYLGNHQFNNSIFLNYVDACTNEIVN